MSYSKYKTYKQRKIERDRRRLAANQVLLDQMTDQEIITLARKCKEVLL